MIRPALAAMLATASIAQGETYEATYDVYLGGFRGGELRLSVSRDEGGYAAEAEMRAVGLAGLLLPAEARAAADGASGPDGPTPRRFAAVGRFGGDPQVVEMTFDGGPAVDLRADPPLRERDYDPDLSRMGDALDPLSAAVAALAPVPAAEACGRTLSVFDSRRRIDLALAPAERLADGRLRCEGVYRRVAGFKDSQMRKPDHPFTVWWSVADDRARFERAQAPTSLGHVVARRRD
jgi:hypothetical protein